MLASLRKTLVESHVAAIAIAMMIYLVMDDLVHALVYFVVGPALYAAVFLALAISERELPYFSNPFNSEWAFLYLKPLICILRVIFMFVTIWLFSRSVYGVGPFRCLAAYRNKLMEKPHA
jgi:hypothetical protein